MPHFIKIRIIDVTIICLSTLLYVTGAGAVMDPRFELDPQVLAGKKSNEKPSKTGIKRTPRAQVSQSPPSSAKARIYTVKSGDHLFKILMRDFALNNSEAESFIEEIKRENNIYDIKRIKIGQ